MNKPPYIVTDNSIVIILEGQSLTMEVTHPNWRAVMRAVADENWDDLPILFDLAAAVEDYAEGNVEVKDGAIYHSGEIIHNVIVDKVLDFMRHGLPFKPLLRFLDKLMVNPSRRAVKELYTFLEHKNMPLTPDGNFVAYKGVTEDFLDHYSRKFDNSVGQTLSMVRNSVCDDAEIGCSYGFHAGSHEYAKGYASGGGHLMLVEIDPADVVSVPVDCSCQKLRTAKYKVVALHETIEKPLEAQLYGEWDDDEEMDSDAWGAAYQAGYDAAKENENLHSED